MSNGDFVAKSEGETVYAEIANHRHEALQHPVIVFNL